ncbi:unnamed protein product [Lactuca saligna]|uniref:Exoribonuclease phosphorolytic domain-containing protein n=1 Tax=Lactuca saligna TaxID=75948 RepID=A0AA35V611_LACSI|nr:unnamed protein product [Lactuca saligna]
MNTGATGGEVATKTGTNIMEGTDKVGPALLLLFTNDSLQSLIGHLNLDPNRVFDIGGIAQGLPTDGCKRLTYCPISIETGVITQENGSARVKMGKTEVIALTCLLNLLTNNHRKKKVLRKKIAFYDGGFFALMVVGMAVIGVAILLTHQRSFSANEDDAERELQPWFAKEDC